MMQMGKRAFAMAKDWAVLPAPVGPIIQITLFMTVLLIFFTEGFPDIGRGQIGYISA